MMLNQDNKKFNLRKNIFIIIILIIIALFFYFNFLKTVAHGQAMQVFLCQDGRMVVDHSLCLAEYATSSPEIKKSVYLQNNLNLAEGIFNELDPTDYPYCVYLLNNLSYGSRDRATRGDVSALQRYLSDRGFLETGATGFFGRATQLAVMKLQFRNEIDPTGVVGPITRETLRGLTCDPLIKMIPVNKPVSPSGRKYFDQDLSGESETRPIENIDFSSTSSAVIIPPTNSKIPVINNPKINPNKIKPVVTGPVTVKIPPTNNPKPNPTTVVNNGPVKINTPENNFLRLTAKTGTFSSASQENLYFIYKSTADSPEICLALDKINCTNDADYQELIDATPTKLYEANNLTDQWLMTLYYDETLWGAIGKTVKIYFRDNPEQVSAVYTLNIQ